MIRLPPYAFVATYTAPTGSLFAPAPPRANAGVDTDAASTNATSSASEATRPSAWISFVRIVIAPSVRGTRRKQLQAVHPPTSVGTSIRRRCYIRASPQDPGRIQAAWNG